MSQKDAGCFPTANRPKEVVILMKNAHPWADQEISVNFVTDWWKWWGDLYPDESAGVWELHISWPLLSKAGANSMLIFLLLLAWLGQAMGKGRRALDGQESWKKAVEQVTWVLQNVKVFILQSREDGGTVEDDSTPKAAHALGSKSRKRGKSKGNHSVEPQPSKKKSDHLQGFHAGGNVIIT
ncbi:hypothetical protein L208DRAFT_1381415 [Tricholoma matsutake]|nr:hypothetical protein L208DRAFT_1381415 [Tricholoma matsutake 945]